MIEVLKLLLVKWAWGICKVTKNQICFKIIVITSPGHINTLFQFREKNLNSYSLKTVFMMLYERHWYQM